MTHTATASRSTARIYALEAWYEFIRMLRMPAFAIPTLLFTPMFYIVFALVLNFGTALMPVYLLATYGVFGVMGAAMFGFGANIAVERDKGWLLLKRASPMPAGAYFGAKIAMALVFSTVIVVILFGLGGFFGDVALERWRWFALAGTLLIGALPFCALGLAIGYWANAEAAVAIVNLIYLPMAVLSGLWFPLSLFPDIMQKFAWVFPAFHHAQLALEVTGLGDPRPVAIHIAVLAGFTVVFLALAFAGWRRSEDS